MLASIGRGREEENVSKFVVDAGVVLRLANGSVEVSPDHELLAPTLVRSETLSLLHEAVARGELAAHEGLERHRRISRLPIRLLGDAVLRRRAWDIADRLGWETTYRAEYVALTQLQADAFVTLDEELARRLEGIVATATIDALR
jgi:predicted nucleic acid-binding protein